MTTTYYGNKQNAARAARKALGPEAVPGLDFNLHQTNKGWTWGEMPPVKTVAARGDTSAEAIFAPKPEPEVAAAAARKALAKGDPAALVVGGVTYPNITLANQARRRLENPPVAKPVPTAPGQPKRTKHTVQDAPPASPKAPPAAGKRAALVEAAQRGEMPTPPNCELESNKRHRPMLAQLQALIAAGDIEGLRAVEIKLSSSTPKALDRYRNLAIVALQARA